MKVLSTGDDATWKNHRRMAIEVFGENSPAVKKMDELIGDKDPESECELAEKSVVKQLLAAEKSAA